MATLRWPILPGRLPVTAFFVYYWNMMRCSGLQTVVICKIVRLFDTVFDFLINCLLQLSLCKKDTICPLLIAACGFRPFGEHRTNANKRLTKKIARKVLVLCNIIFKRNFLYITSYHHHRLHICNDNALTTRCFR